MPLIDVPGHTYERRSENFDSTKATADGLTSYIMTTTAPNVRLYPTGFSASHLRSTKGQHKDARYPHCHSS
eukprot:6195958-Pleurochrysis_carterae.AAC.2